MTNPIKKTRKQYSSQFKLERSLEAFKTDNLTAIARQYGISVNILSMWRQQLLANGTKVFSSTPDQDTELLKKKIARLEQMLGKKEVELSLLKNFSDFYESQKTP